MKEFPLPLEGKFVGEGQWELIEPFEYHSKIGGVIKIPVGFVSDGASIPKVFYSLIGGRWTGKYVRAALPHDYLYYTKTFTRRKSDEIFLEAMTVLGVTKWKRSVMFMAVRIGGYFPWHKRKPFITGRLAAMLMVILLLSSCAVLDIAYDKNGRVKKVWSTGIQDTAIEQEKDGVKTTVKRKAAFDLWPTNLFTIYKD